jgi:hypothetical protein
MNEQQLKQLWQSSEKQMEELQWLSKKNTDDIIQLKTKSFLSSMKPTKIFTVVIGLLWVVLIDALIVFSFRWASPYFLISAGIQVLLTKIAIGVYLYQLILIQQVDLSEPVLKSQERLAKLKSSTLGVTRILFLQLPVWTTFYLSKSIFENGNILLFIIQTVLTLSFTFVAVWLFLNIKYENRNKKWFQLIFSGKEWTPIMKAMEQYENTRTYRQEE